MKIDIPYYIRQVLREQRMVHIPGIGTLRLNQQSAQFNDNKSFLNPPYLQLEFDDTESSNDGLFNYIFDTGKYTEEKIRKKLEQYTQTAFNTLLNVDAFEIEGVGSIKKKEVDDNVVFEPNLDALTREYRALKPLALHPIQRISQQAPLPLTPAPVEESGSLLPRILVLSILLIALYFIGKHFYDNHNQEKDKTEVGTIQKDGKEVKLAMTDSSNLDLEQKYEEIDQLIDPDNSDNSTKQKSEEIREDDEDQGLDKAAIEDGSPVTEKPTIDNEDLNNHNSSEAVEKSR